MRAVALLLLGCILVVAASAFASPSLYVPGIALVGLALAAAVWVRLAAHGARVVRVTGSPSIVEEVPYPMRVEARAGTVMAPGGDLVEPLVPGAVPIAWRRARVMRVSVRFARRGRRVLEPARLTIRDPLGLVSHEIRCEPAEVLVLPRVEPVLAAGAGARGQGVASAPSGLQVRAAELELDSLRPYREGAPASRIHWPAVARTGQMIERRLVAGAEARPLVVLDSRAAASEEALDSAVRAVASLCAHLCVRGGCSLLLPGDRRPAELDDRGRSWPAQWARLALVEPGGALPSPERLGRAGAVFWVTARAGTDPLPALRRWSAAVRFLVTPGAPTASAAFTVAGCSGRRVGAARPRVAA